MRKASIINKALLLLVLFFGLMAAVSFAAFQETETLCSSPARKCSQVRKSGGGMLWDDFPKRFISFVSVR